MAGNFFDQFDGAQGEEATVQQAARPTLYERFKANMDAGTLEGTPEGAVGYLMRQAVEDAQRRNGMPIDPSFGRDRDALQNYETMPAWESIPEGAAALAGQLVGGLKAPSSFIGGTVAPVREAVTQGAAKVLPKTAAEAAGRTAEQGVVQAGIQTAVNPIVQGANVASGVQESFDPNALATAPFMGFALGAAAHGLTEGAGAFRDAAVFHAMREKLATSDPDFSARPGPANDTGPAAPAQPAVVPEPRVSEVDPVAVDARDTGSDAASVFSPSEPQGRPLTLSEFVARGGGIPLDGEARSRDLNRAFIPGAGPIARKAGKSIDGFWREALIEEGYFPRDPDGGAARDITKELSDALDAERQGRKIYSVQDEGRIPQEPDHISAAVEAEASRISREMEAAGVTRDTLHRGALYTAAERMFKGEDHDPISAYERAVMELPEDTRAGAPLMFPEAAADLQFRKGRPKAEPLQFKKRVNTPTDGSGSPTGPVQSGGSAEHGNAAQRASMSLQQQALHLAETMDLPLRQGRVRGGKDALGQYDRTQGVARVKQVPDFETVAHEGGHHLEAQMGQPLKDLIAKNAAELAPLDYDQTKLRPSEGFAEFFSHYLVNPAYAKREAPTFYDAFRALLADKRPDLLDALDGAAREFQAFRNAPDTEKVGLSVVDQEHETWTSEARASLERDGLAPTIMAMVGRAYMAIFDRHAPVAQYVRTMLELAHEKNGGKLIDLKAADNPEVLIRLLERSKQGAEYQFRYGVVPYHDADAVGPSLHDALALATGQPSLLGNWDDEMVGKFADYLAAKRAVVLWDKVADGRLLRDPTPFSKDVALNAMAELEKANPGFAQASMMVHEFSRNLLKKQLDGGLIERDLYDRLIADPFYVPLYRDMEDKALSGPTAGGQSPQGPGMTDTIKRQKGSLRDIINPIQGLMAQTFLVERTLRHNDVIKALVGLAEMAGNGAGRYVEKIPAKEMAASRFDLAEGIRNVAREKAVDPDSTEALLASLTDAFGDDPIMATTFRAQPARAKGEPIVFYKEGGELRAARIVNSKEGLELYDLLTSLPRATQDIFSSVLGMSAQVLRSGITSNPTFILTNYIRDQFAVGVLRQGYIPIVSGLKGIKAEITQDEAARLYSYFGGGMPGAVAGTLHAAEASDINAIGKRSFGQIRLGEGLKGLSEVMSITEAATRDSVFAQVYKQKLAEGLSKYEAGIEAAFQATDLLDFSRHGSRMEAVRRFIPFLNAHLQGLDKARRTILEPLAQAARGTVYTTAEKAAVQNAKAALIKFAALGSALGATYAAFMGENIDYRDADPEMKAKHLVIPIGGKVYLIPKPFELALGFNAGEEAVMALAKQDPRAAARFAAGAWSILQPPNPLTEQPLIRTAFELQTGKSMYTGSDIVPERLKGLEPWQQFTDRTSPIAKKVGEVTGWSPIKVDYAIGSLFGTNGRDIMSASSIFEPNGPVQALEDRVFFRRLIKDPDRVSSATREWWTLAAARTGTFAQAMGTYDALVSAGNQAGADQYLARQPNEVRALITLNSAGDENGKKVFSTEEKRLNPLVRAQGAVSAASGVASELVKGQLQNTATDQQIEGLTPADRRNAIDAVKHLAAMEQRNALILTGQPGWDGQALLDVKQQMAVIRAISPEVADEVARRYATNNVYTTEAVAKVWPQARQLLVKQGGEADLSALQSSAEAAGYEFGADRVKKRQRRRNAIQPSVEAVP